MKLHFNIDDDWIHKKPFPDDTSRCDYSHYPACNRMKMHQNNVNSWHYLQTASKHLGPSMYHDQLRTIAE